MDKSKEEISFLSLPGEIRNRIYNLLMPEYQSIYFTPQTFNETFPEQVSLLIRPRHWTISHPREVKVFRRLIRLNRQIRSEVLSMFFARPGAEGKKRQTYRFRGEFPREMFQVEPDTKLTGFERYAALYILRDLDMPFAVLRTPKTRTFWKFWVIHKYELLIPDYSTGGLVKWMKLSEFRKGDPETEADSRVWSAWRKYEKRRTRRRCCCC